MPSRAVLNKATGKNIDRHGWQKLQRAINAGQVKQLVIWRLDRLGRTASGLCKLFDDTHRQKGLSGKPEGFCGPGTPSGRLITYVLASVAAYETEVRGEQVKAIVRMNAEDEKGASIARTVNLSRITIYRVIDCYEQELIELDVAS